MVYMRNNINTLFSEIANGLGLRPALSGQDGNQDDAGISRTGSDARCRRAGWKFDAREDGEGCNDRCVLDHAPLHADEKIAGSGVETA